jgi:TrkA domain protein
MAEVFETPLPGVGVRYELHTQRGDQLGVLAHRSGRYELVLYDADDRDAAARAVLLERSDAQALVDLLGGSQIVERLGSLRQHLTDLALDWITIPKGAPSDGQSIGETELRTRTGASIVAIVRDDTSIPAPGPDTQVQAGDVVVVVGTDEGIEAASRHLRGG